MLNSSRGLKNKAYPNQEKTTGLGHQLVLPWISKSASCCTKLSFFRYIDYLLHDTQTKTAVRYSPSG